MNKNVGRADQLMRGVVGPALMAAGYFLLGGNRGRLLGLATIVTGVMIGETAITRVCPVNALAHLDTRSEAERAHDQAEILAQPVDLGAAHMH
jgi:hypothetical protein